MSGHASPRWALALDQFSETAALDGLAPSTTRRVRKHVAGFAGVCGTPNPWHVTAEMVEAWLGGLDCSTQALYAYRTSIRTFYRWATRQGLVTTDPTEPVRTRLRRLVAPDAWESEIVAFQRYLRAAGRPQTTIELRRDQLTHLARTIHLASPWEVTTDDLYEWMGSHRWAPETLRARRSAIRQFYAWAVESGRISTSPAATLPIVRPTQPVPRPADDTDILHAMCNATPRSRLMVRLAAEAGLRRAEVAQVHARDLELIGPTWWLWVNGKGARRRRVPLTQSLADELRARGQGWAFPGNYAGHLSPRYVGKLVSELLPEGVTMHAMRHRFATQAYAIDRDVFAVQQLLGHSSPATTQRYVQVPDAGLTRLVGAVSLAAWTPVDSAPVVSGS